ncbi:hypothetical protein GQR58_023046 [Nymphon striatum]|nr:hypothetical protein GQR58_023046 [Nymphon striatum]
MSEGTFGKDTPTAYYDLFRLEDGQVVEHWDVIAPIPAKSEWKNTNVKMKFIELITTEDYRGILTELTEDVELNLQTVGSAKGKAQGIELLKKQNQYLKNEIKEVKVFKQFEDDKHLVIEYDIVLNNTFDLPLVVILVKDGSKYSSIRTYHSVYPITEGHIFRASIFKEEIKLTEPTEVVNYFDGITIGSVEATMDTLSFEDDVYFREPAGWRWNHKTKDGLREHFQHFFADAAFGLLLGVMGYFIPDMVIPGFTGDTDAHNMAIWMTSARNIAMGVVMIYALVSKNPALIGLAFIMRLATEFFDMFGTAASGVMGVPSASYLYSQLLVFHFFKENIMVTIQQEKIEATLAHLFNDSKYDMAKAMRGMAKSIFKPIQPSDFKDAYLSISKEQGEDLVELIKENNIQNIVEFGTSFELIESKAQKAIENFNEAGVSDLIEVRVGDAKETLKNYTDSIDLLLLDGWKDLYLTIFQLLESNFHAKTIIYVDNADMGDTQTFLQTKINEEAKATWKKLQSLSLCGYPSKPIARSHI